MTVLLCLFAAKKRPGSTTTTSTTPPTNTTGNTTTASGKKTRTVGVQHNVVPISLGHGFRAIGGSQDLFDDSQDDDDIQLTQNTPPRPATPPSNTPPALGGPPSLVPPQSVPPSSVPPPSAPLAGMSTGHNNLQVIQDSFKAIQDGLSAISSYIMNTGSQSQVPTGLVPQAPQVQGTSSSSGMHSLSTIPLMTNVPLLQPIPTLQSTSVVNTCATLQAGCSLASGMVVNASNVVGNAGNVAGTGVGTGITSGLFSTVPPVQVGTMTTQVVTQAGHNVPNQGFVATGAHTGTIAAAGHHAHSQGSPPVPTASYNVHNQGSAPNSMPMPTLTLTPVGPVSGNFTGISVSVTQPLPLPGGATAGPIGGIGGGIGATTVATAGGTAQGAVEPRQVISMGLPLGHAVDPKIKEMIWQNKFIELHLLVKPESEDDYDVHLNPKEGCFQFRRKKSSISSILTWCDAMQTYQSVMMMDERTAKDVPDFLTYIKDVRGIADEGWDWVFYDDEYRKYRASCEHPQPWSVHRLDFYNQARRKTLAAQKKASFAYNNASRFASPLPMVYGSSQFQQGQVGQFPGPNSISGVPKGYCFYFHIPQQKCTRVRCSFKHLCFICSRGEHAAYNCRNARPQAYPTPVWPNQFQPGWPNQSPVRQPAGIGQVNEHRQQGPRASAPRQQLSNSFKQSGNTNTGQ